MTGDAKWFASTFEKIHMPQEKEWIRQRGSGWGRGEPGWLFLRAAAGEVESASGALTCLSAQMCPTAWLCKRTVLFLKLTLDFYC